MKITDNKVEVVSNMKFDESVEMGIGHDAVPMVIERLISTYNQPARAVLREYTSNAYDIHVQGGVSVPVEVSLPDALSPSLRVRDYGVGLSRDELKGFGQFGVSTKRDSNDYTGGFGLGSKSGLAVASQFTVMSIKDGRRNTVIVARDEENRPHMNFLPETDTDEPSGTLITVPISNRSSLGDVGDFFLGWKPGSILVDDEAPKRSVYNAEHFRPVKNLGWYDLSGVSSPRDGIRVLINQVIYVLDYKNMGVTYNEWMILKRYVVKLDNGSVKLAPSREDLIYNSPTKAVIRQRVDAILAIAGEEMAESVSSAPSVKEALIALERLRASGYPTDIAKWGGKRILLPGTMFMGNRVPAGQGTWALPTRTHNTKTGFTVERKEGSLASLRTGSDYPNRKFVIIHSADPATNHQSGSSRPRYLHREAFGVADWLTTVDDGNGYYEVFITSDSLGRVNRWCRDLADIVLDASDFNAVVKTVREDRAKQERTDAKARQASSKLKVLIGSYDGVPSVREMSLSDISDKYDQVILLRNQDRGIAGTIRESLTTKKNYYSKYSYTGLNLASEANAAMILLSKNVDVSDALALLPPVTTFSDLAAEKIKASYVTKTAYESMAVRDREEYNLIILQGLTPSAIGKVKNVETRKWLEAVVNYKDSGFNIREKFSWMKSDPVVKAAYDSATTVSNTAKTLAESPAKRYPLLLEMGYHYRVNDSSVVHYVNLCDTEILSSS